MSKFFSVRTMLVAVVVGLMAFALVGCGSDDSGSASTQTGVGAPDGAEGDESGGAAVEAGKQRSEEDKANEAENFSKEPPPIQIQSGNASGYSVNKPTAVIIKSNAEAKKWQREIYSGAGKAGKAPWASTDFKTRQFVAVFLPSSAAGTQVAITDISGNGSTVKVEAIRLKPGSGCKESGGEANPWQVVETRKMSGTAKLELETQSSSPC